MEDDAYGEYLNFGDDESLRLPSDDSHHNSRANSREPSRNSSTRESRSQSRLATRSRQSSTAPESVYHSTAHLKRIMDAREDSAKLIKTMTAFVKAVIDEHKAFQTLVENEDYDIDATRDSTEGIHYRYAGYFGTMDLLSVKRPPVTFLQFLVNEFNGELKTVYRSGTRIDCPAGWSDDHRSYLEAVQALSHLHSRLHLDMSELDRKLQRVEHFARLWPQEIQSPQHPSLNARLHQEVLDSECQDLDDLHTELSFLIKEQSRQMTFRRDDMDVSSITSTLCELYDKKTSDFDRFYGSLHDFRFTVKNIMGIEKQPRPISDEYRQILRACWISIVEKLKQETVGHREADYTAAKQKRPHERTAQETAALTVWHNWHYLNNLCAARSGTMRKFGTLRTRAKLTHDSIQTVERGFAVIALDLHYQEKSVQDLTSENAAKQKPRMLHHIDDSSQLHRKLIEVQAILHRYSLDYEEQRHRWGDYLAEHHQFHYILSKV